MPMAAERARRRILDDDEVRAVWAACADLGTFGAILKILLLTGQRRDKVVTMKWDDLVDGEWRIATAPREKSNSGSLRLPNLSKSIRGLFQKILVAGLPCRAPEAASRGGPVRSGRVAKLMSFSAKRCAYCPRPSFWSQSATCCIGGPLRI